MEETWKTIKKHPTYKISNLGRVKSLSKKVRYSRWGGDNFRLTKEKIVSTSINNSGYVIVHLYTNNKSHTKTVHRIVAEAFIKNPKNKPQVNHKDSNKENNNYKNLEWTTISENNIHGLKSGRLKSGEDSHFSKLTKEQVLEIRSRWTNRRGHTQELAKEFGVSQEMIRRIIKKLNWRYI